MPLINKALALINEPLIPGLEVPFEAPNSGNNPGGLPVTFDGPQTIENPLKGVADSIPALLKKILEIVVQIGLPLIALAIIYAGFLYVTARGNSEKLAKAHQAFLWTMVGAAVILGAFVIQTAIEGTIASLK